MAHGPVQAVDFFKPFIHFLSQAGALDGTGNLAAQAFQCKLLVCANGTGNTALNIQHAQHLAPQFDRYSHLALGMRQ